MQSAPTSSSGPSPAFIPTPPPNGESETVETESPPSSNENASPSADAPSPALRNEGSLTAYARNEVKYDLDSSSGDLEWGLGSAGQTGDGMPEGPRLGDAFPQLYFYSPSAYVFMGTRPLTYQTCVQAILAPDSSSVNVGELAQGTGFCVKTSAGRVAALAVAQEANAMEVSFNVQVWEKDPSA